MICQYLWNDLEKRENSWKNKYVISKITMRVLPPNFEAWMSNKFFRTTGPFWCLYLYKFESGVSVSPVSILKLVNVTSVHSRKYSCQTSIAPYSLRTEKSCWIQRVLLAHQWNILMVIWNKGDVNHYAVSILLNISL